ncbi:MAG: hypothetical protein IJ672_09745 [Methanobrevibacter sp.]|uniref:hypothetical protein n=1 Tax=Methanobrevibacter sp. TaxID=66852 RepID=UPI0025E0FF08|nr:hypothetical protein [Methanobrevibacter sp.]MBQ8017387.1 hypothetical protein [Methanobrevibacter sp.]MBR1611742.1 hypothetical protein [Methanobrevibacter sp.]
MKFNSKILGAFLALLVIALVISTASAVDLVNDFGIDVLSGADFNENTNISMDDINWVILENSGNNSDDVNTIIYFKDSTHDKNSINKFIKDLEDDGQKVEETDKYTVFKTTENSNDFDFPSGFDNVLGFAENIFSLGNGVNISADGNSVSLSDEGLKVSDAGGENVSISSDGISVSGDSSSDDESMEISDDIDSNFVNLDYYLFLKNNANDEVVVIFGNDLNSLKSMAETASFNEN